MSSFLCFVCHSTVNADTNEETREKYREVIGMNLCPDSHLCFICCYFLNKMCLFKSICLKRSLEYPVLFSEKGTINLQRSDIQVAILCPEDICLQHLNTRYHFYNNSDNSQSDFDDNSYCQLHDERNFENRQKNDTDEFKDDYLFKGDNIFDDNLIGPNMEPVRVMQDLKQKEDRRDGEKNAVLLELESKIEVTFEEVLPNSEIDANKKYTDKYDSVERSSNEEEDAEDRDEIIVGNGEVNLEFTEALPNTEHEQFDVDTTQTEQDSKGTQKKKKKRKKEFEKIKLTVKEQKKELEDARKEEKYISASYKCYNCALTFHFKDSYQAHMMRHEESNGEYRCLICSLRFANPAILRSHNSNHSERYKCTRCEAIVRARQRITHSRSCRDRGGNVYCHLCGSKFMGHTHLQQHLKRYHQSKTSNRIHLCNICGKSYNNQAAVRTHMITHINRKFPCDQCTSTFSSPYTLNQHKKIHNSSDHELHYCTTCEIGYTSRKSFLAHMRNALAHKETVYKCPVCDRTCPSLKSLQQHTAEIHAKTKHLPCSMCAARFSTRKSLVDHLRRHKQQRPKVTPLCHSCGENFKSTSILKRHLKNVCEKDKIEEELNYFEQ